MRPSKIEWLVAGLLFLFLFASWCFGDTTAIVGHEVDFADSLLHGEISNFYQRAHERAGKIPGHGKASYDLPVNFVLAIWGLPFYAVNNNTQGGGCSLQRFLENSLRKKFIFSCFHSMHDSSL